jgi:hypothetical protein
VSAPSITSDGWLVVAADTGSGYQLFAQQRGTGSDAWGSFASYSE